ncbi:hypothetical protein K438DRAFT_1754889 [Mycena galopus ATCC 62051]|nr:hypothetical protein K438DRAFT_1754889 [Mycena galopus ATCC 62051]
MFVIQLIFCTQSALSIEPRFYGTQMPECTVGSASFPIQLKAKGSRMANCMVPFVTSLDPLTIYKTIIGLNFIGRGIQQYMLWWIIFNNTAEATAMCYRVSISGT